MSSKNKDEVIEEVKKELQHQQKEENKDSKHLESIMQHIENVQKNCRILAKRLMEDEGNPDSYDIGFKVLKNSYLHDNSKFSGIEWKYLRTPDLIKESDCSSPEDQKKCFMLALEQHTKNNMHHPECWNRIKDMPPEYVAEMVCDLCARSSEFGTDLRDWVKSNFLPKYGITTSSKIYKDMKKYIDMLLPTAFKQIK